MPKKIRELKALLRKAGFTWLPGKGSHTKWHHPLSSKDVILSGKDGRDARRYQEEEVQERIEEVQRRQHS
jgi:predicted RNA binding protein YcfA (HicA-like mRNA interferase family)